MTSSLPWHASKKCVLIALREQNAGQRLPAAAPAMLDLSWVAGISHCVLDFLLDCVRQCRLSQGVRKQVASRVFGIVLARTSRVGRSEAPRTIARYRWHLGRQPSCRWLARRRKVKSARPLPFPLFTGRIPSKRDPASTRLGRRDPRTERRAVKVRPRRLLRCQ